ncbi:hypothetical protein C8J57DRAFT_1478053, partial [Mycena rebaudengoi]
VYAQQSPLLLYAFQSPYPPRSLTVFGLDQFAWASTRGCPHVLHPSQFDNCAYIDVSGSLGLQYPQVTLFSTNHRFGPVKGLRRSQVLVRVSSLLRV